MRNSIAGFEFIRNITQQRDVEANNPANRYDLRTEWLQSLLDSGMYPAQFSRHVGVSHNVLMRQFERRGMSGFIDGVKTNGAKVNTDVLADFVAMVADGMTPNEMAIKLGRPSKGVRSYLWQHGLKAARSKRMPKAVSTSLVHLVRTLIDVNGMTPYAIAGQTGIPISRIKKIAAAM